MAVRVLGLILLPEVEVAARGLLVRMRPSVVVMVATGFLAQLLAQA
jgi:hypothetical protein